MNRFRLGTWLAGLGFRPQKTAPAIPVPPPQAWTDYAGLVRQEVYDWLCEDTDGVHPLDVLTPANTPATAGVPVLVELSLWLDKAGAVVRASVSGGNDDLKTLAALKALLLECRISAPPPDDLLQPVRLRLTLATPDKDAPQPDAGLSPSHQG